MPTQPVGRREDGAWLSRTNGGQRVSVIINRSPYHLSQVNISASGMVYACVCGIVPDLGMWFVLGCTGSSTFFSAGCGIKLLFGCLSINSPKLFYFYFYLWLAGLCVCRSPVVLRKISRKNNSGELRDRYLLFSIPLYICICVLLIMWASQSDSV